MREIKPGIYRHFKGNLYQVHCIATHTETGEKYVVYTAMYGNFEHYIRPYNMFASKVDHEKYPDCKCDYRFTEEPSLNKKFEPIKLSLKDASIASMDEVRRMFREDKKIEDSIDSKNDHI